MGAGDASELKLRIGDSQQVICILHWSHFGMHPALPLPLTDSVFGVCVCVRVWHSVLFCFSRGVNCLVKVEQNYWEMRMVLVKIMWFIRNERHILWIRFMHQEISFTIPHTQRSAYLKYNILSFTTYW